MDKKEIVYVRPIVRFNLNLLFFKIPIEKPIGRFKKYNDKLNWKIKRKCKIIGLDFKIKTKFEINFKGYFLKGDFFGLNNLDIDYAKYFKNNEEKKIGEKNIHTLEEE